MKTNDDLPIAGPIEAIWAISLVNFESFLNGTLNANELRQYAFIIPTMWANNTVTKQATVPQERFGPTMENRR